MNLTYIGIDAKRQLRDISTWMFVIALPVGMYLLFGLQDYGSLEIGYGNWTAYIMVSMAAYAASMATCNIAGQAAAEAVQGWGRQISLTKQPRYGFVVNKLVLAVVMAALGSAIVFVCGALTGAELTGAWRWALAFGAAVVGSALFALLGLGVGLWFKSEAAVGAASGALVFFAFFGNVFMPLSGVMLDIAKFTPMYGYVALVRWPQLEGLVMDGEVATYDSLWAVIANVAVWLLVFGGIALLGLRRARTR